MTFTWSFIATCVCPGLTIFLKQVLNCYMDAKLLLSWVEKNEKHSDLYNGQSWFLVLKNLITSFFNSSKAYPFAVPGTELTCIVECYAWLCSPLHWFDFLLSAFRLFLNVLLQTFLQIQRIYIYFSLYVDLEESKTLCI